MFEETARQERIGSNTFTQSIEELESLAKDCQLCTLRASLTGMRMKDPDRRKTPFKCSLKEYPEVDRFEFESLHGNYGQAFRIHMRHERKYQSTHNAEGN